MSLPPPVATAASLIALLVAVTGCDESSYPIAPVAGKVTLDGKPLAGAKIKFQPVATGNSVDAGGGSYATTDEQGNFTLALILQDGEGAVVGEHRVTITTGQVDPHSDQSKITGERVPMAFRDGSLRFTVPPEGTTEANFEMTSSR